MYLSGTTFLLNFSFIFTVHVNFAKRYVSRKALEYFKSPRLVVEGLIIITAKLKKSIAMFLCVN